jgi:hypothetical protein
MCHVYTGPSTTTPPPHLSLAGVHVALVAHHSDDAVLDGAGPQPVQPVRHLIEGPLATLCSKRHRTPQSSRAWRATHTNTAPGQGPSRACGWGGHTACQQEGVTGDGCQETHQVSDVVHNNARGCISVVHGVDGPKLFWGREENNTSSRVGSGWGRVAADQLLFPALCPPPSIFPNNRTQMPHKQGVLGGCVCGGGGGRGGWGWRGMAPPTVDIPCPTVSHRLSLHVTFSTVMVFCAYATTRLGAGWR